MRPRPICKVTHSLEKERRAMREKAMPRQAITHGASLSFSKLSCVSPWLASGNKIIHMRFVQPSKPYILIEGGRKLRQNMEVW